MLIQRISMAAADDETMPHLPIVGARDSLDDPERTVTAGVGSRRDRPRRNRRARAGCKSGAVDPLAPMKTARTGGVVRASVVMAVATLASRATGFLSKVILLGVLGVGIVNDAYTIANTLPNIVFELLIGGRADVGGDPAAVQGADRSGRRGRVHPTADDDGRGRPGGGDRRWRCSRRRC